MLADTLTNIRPIPSTKKSRTQPKSTIQKQNWENHTHIRNREQNQESHPTLKPILNLIQALLILSSIVWSCPSSKVFYHCIEQIFCFIKLFNVIIHLTELFGMAENIFGVMIELFSRVEHVFGVMVELFDGAEHILGTWEIPLNPPSLFFHCELCHIFAGSLPDFEPWTISLQPFGYGRALWHNWASPRYFGEPFEYNFQPHYHNLFFLLSSATFSLATSIQTALLNTSNCAMYKVWNMKWP